MIRRTGITAPLILALLLPLSACGGSGKADAEAVPGKEQKEEHAGGERVTISAEAAEASDLGFSTAGPGAIQETLELTGRITLQPSARAEIHAPYPGPVRSLSRNIGDRVQKGETLARVESAESLQTYPIASPIAGVVLDRQTNIGDVTGGDPLFVVGDLSRIQAELNVATRDIGRVTAGQSVVVSGLDGNSRVEATIAAVLPTANADSQTLIARAPMRISPESPIRPGMAIRGAVVLSEQEAPIAIESTGLQNFEGKQVVFVRVAPDVFEARAVTVGRSGKSTVEITSGLKLGEVYVSKNAFLVKAEIGKGAASHDD